MPAPGDAFVDVQVKMLLDDIPENGMLLLGQVLSLLPQLRVSVTAHPHGELRGPEVLHQLAASHVLSLGDVGQLLGVLLVERLLLRPKLFDVGLGLGFVAVVDELEVHVDKNWVENQGQLVAVEVKRGVHEALVETGRVWSRLISTSMQAVLPLRIFFGFFGGYHCI